MKKFYIVRHGWNSANQPSRGASARPQNTFESRLDQLVAVVEADSLESARSAFAGTVYNNQHIWITSNPRAKPGLVDAIRQFEGNYGS